MDPNARVCDAYNGVVGFALYGQRYLAALRRELTSIMKQISYNLRQPGWIDVNENRLIRQGYYQVLSTSVGLRPNRLNDLLDPRPEIDSIAAKLDFAATDAIHVQQVVNQTDHLGNLA